MFLLYPCCSLLLVFIQKFRSSRSVTWNKVTYNCLLLKAELNWQVEAYKKSSILWVVQFAKSENWDHVIFEGDAKVCFDPLSFPLWSPDWSIGNIISNILYFKKPFISCCFSWLKRECNVVDHAAAKFSRYSCQSFCFNNHSFPNFFVTL